MKRRLEIGLDASFMMTFDEDYSLKYLVKAEEAGFDFLWLGDHILPWHDSFKHSFFVWSLLPAVASRTRHIRMGVDVTVPIGGRYHPAIIAQASATIDRIFPGRFCLGVGAGEAMNEARFMGYWPKWEERIDRLVEGIDLIRKLWESDDYFNFNGRYFKMANVCLHPKPKTRIPIYFSAIGEKAAYVAGKHSDMLMTVGTVERCERIIFPKFDDGVSSMGKDPNRTEKAISIDGGVGMPSEILKRIKKLSAGGSLREMFNERDPRKIEKAGSGIPDEQILRDNYIRKSAGELIEVFDKFHKIGATQVIWDDFSPSPDKIMNEFRTTIIPYFKEQAE